MRKLSLVVSVLCMMACRDALEATQTVVLITATQELRPQIKAVEVQAFALPDNEPGDKRLHPMDRDWLKVTLLPSGTGFDERFRLEITARGQDDEALAKVELESLIVHGASRYIALDLDETCLAACRDTACQHSIDREGLHSSDIEALANHLSCSATGLVVTMSADGMKDGDDSKGTVTGTSAQRTNGSSPQDGTSTSPQTGMASASNDAMTPSDSSATPEMGMGMASPSDPALCASMPCGDHGFCNPDPDRALGYACDCDVGYQEDETGSTCIERNDCELDNGGCIRGECEKLPTGEAKCSCPDPGTWLASDEKTCAAFGEPVRLSSLAGSLERTRPQVAFDAAGNGVAVWAETSISGNTAVWSARYDAQSRTWKLPTTPIVPYAPEVAELALALTPSGSGMLTFTVTGQESHRQLWGVSYLDQAFVGLRQVDGDSALDAFSPSMALDANGDGIATWSEDWQPGNGLRIARFRKDTGLWGRAQRVESPPDKIALEPRVTLNGEGNGFLAVSSLPVKWNDEQNFSLDYFGVSVFHMRISPQLEIPLNFSDVPMHSTDAAVDSAGTVIAVWLKGVYPTAGNEVVARVGDPSSNWRPEPTETLKSDAGLIMHRPQVVVGPHGADSTALAAWQQLSGAASFPRQARLWGSLRVNDTFEPARELSPEVSDVPAWEDIDMEPTTAKTAAEFFESRLPNWDLAVLDKQQALVLGMTFDTGASPPARKLWLVRVRPQSELEVLPFVQQDVVPKRPSSPRLSWSPQGTGAIVWDTQDKDRYHAYVSVAQ